MDWTRRSLLIGAAQLAAWPALARAPNGVYPFSLGVASGSPLPDAVVLWTRLLAMPLNAASTPPVPMQVRWEVAHDEGFVRIAAKGVATALPAFAHSVHVDVTGLEPGHWYWYRFMLGDAVSPVGRTRTAPPPDAMPDSLKLAVASCQHWEFGSYGAHRHIARAAPDLVAFLGDYIYEWGPYQLSHPARPVRSHESFTLDDYRARHAQYKSDPDLQAAHQAAPWIVTWDDHEVVNNYAPDPATTMRRAAAWQAYYEHMPVRWTPSALAGMRMYQRYDWGRLARFHVLDDRQYRSSHACAPASSVLRAACAALRDPARTMLGQAQEAWLAEGLRSSKAQWNLIAQQTPMAQSSQLPVHGPRDGRIWTDGWDGYPGARERLFEALRSSGAANPVVLAGDVHTFYASELRMDINRPVSDDNPVLATEFCGTSVTSNSRPQARTAKYVAMNPHIKFGRSDKRGYMLMDVTPAGLTTLCMGLDDVRDRHSAVATLGRFSVEPGRAGLLQDGV